MTLSTKRKIILWVTVLLIVVATTAFIESHIYATALDCEKWVKNKSDEVVKGCNTFEKKVIKLRDFLHRKMVKTKADNSLSVTQLNILKEYYKMYGVSRGEKKVFTKEDYDYFFGQTKPRKRDMRLLMNTCDKLNLGYGVCDDAASAFMHFANKQNIETQMVYLFASRPPNEHTIVEALGPDDKWVILEFDPDYNLKLSYKGKMVSREDIKNNPAIIKKFIKQYPDPWKDKNYQSMYLNGRERVLNYEKTSRTYDNLKLSAKMRMRR